MTILKTRQEVDILSLEEFLSLIPSEEEVTKIRNAASQHWPSASDKLMKGYLKFPLVPAEKFWEVVGPFSQETNLLIQHIVEENSCSFYVHINC